MVDSGVHHVAALRKCMAPDVPCIARAVCTSREPSVSAPDTVVGSIEWESGVVSSVSLCMSSTVVRTPMLQICMCCL
jgi:predicted dehydrogenase